MFSGITPSPAPLAGGSSENQKPLAESVREYAAHLQHAVDLALLASEGEEPERGVCHLVAMIRDIGPQLWTLAAKVGCLPPAES